MADAILDQVISVKDLGVLVTADLRWMQHISEITLKANRTLGLIKRVCKNIKDMHVRKTLYCSLVRPQLEYASELWSPEQITYKRMLENVQRKATKFILDYPGQTSYKERLVQLNLLPLEYRRLWKDLVFFYKCQNGLYDLDLSHIAKKRVSNYATRSFNINNYSEIRCKTDFFKHSYLPRVIKAWNLLPHEFKNISQIRE